MYNVNLQFEKPGNMVLTTAQLLELISKQLSGRIEEVRSGQSWYATFCLDTKSKLACQNSSSSNFEIVPQSIVIFLSCRFIPLFMLLSSKLSGTRF